MNNNSDLNDNRTDSRSEGREMDDVTRNQLNEKQKIVDEFLSRKEAGKQESIEPEGREMDDVTRNQLNEKQKIVDEFLSRKEAEKQESIEQENNREIIPDDSFSVEDEDVIPPDGESSVEENPPGEEFFSFDDDEDEIPPQDVKSSVGENHTGEDVFFDDDEDEIPPPDASGADDQNENKGFSFKDSAINALKVTIMIPGLSQGISHATLSPSQISTYETDRVEQVITVRDEDLPKSPFEEISSKFKELSGLSLFDAASEIAQDDMKRWKLSVDMKETLSVRDDDFSDKIELDSDHLDSTNETSGLI